ncbi:hypothetical protein C2G38_2174660 [Gigaspora rosea]|uniref:Uncharacterized protein n=1 Tax=Gigaspora rosea TaxID=44941 RepID=A0A397VJH3_9GLOM|nr:hypothetical protein C2G38_2174660 [Gigaspora rosea]
MSIIVLEINNAFGEKHLYILNRDTRLGLDMSFTINRAFHVSSFNDRKGIYKAFCKDPRYLYMRLVMYTDSSHPDDISSENVTYKNNTPIQRSRKKLVATASGHLYPLNLLSVIYAIMTYSLEIFLTMPRILKKSYKLHYYKNLGIYHRPIPIEGTVVVLEKNLDDENSGGIKSKQEFDEMLHSHWSAEGVDQAFIASIAQNDDYFDLRLKAIIIIQYLKKGEKNEIFINGEKWLWEGVIKLIKCEKNYKKEICKINDEEKKGNILEGWDVAYERKVIFLDF